MLLRSVMCACTKWKVPGLIPRIHWFIHSCMRFGLIGLRLEWLSSCSTTFQSLIGCRFWIVGGALVRFCLLDTVVNCLSSLSLRTTTFSDHERWRVRAVPSIILTGGSPGATRVGHFVVSFVGFSVEFVCCSG